MPRLTIVLAAAGCALAVFGAVIVGGDGLGGGDGDGSKVPGILLAAGVVVVGFVLLSRFPVGPLGTAGAVAAALGVAPLLFFLTFDDGAFPPYSTDLILSASTGAWIVSYFVGPGRGRSFFLGAAAIGLWLSVVELIEDVFDFPFLALNIVGAGFAEPGFDDGFAIDTPDPTTIGLLSLAFAAVYLALARRWDRTDFSGAATPLTAAALLATPVGILALADDLEATGTGLLTAAIGVALATVGSASARRATAWLGGAAVAIGLLTIIGDAIEEPTPGGLTLMVAGAAVVAAAEMIRRSTDEPDEVDVREEPVAF